MNEVKIESFDKKTMEPKKFSGEVHGVVYNPHPMGFANFSIATVKVEKGSVVSIELSDHYNALETAARLTILNEKLVDRMRKNYPAGFQHV